MKQLFKSFCAYDVGDLQSFSRYEENLAKIQYTPCTATEELSRGFACINGNFITSINGFEFGKIKVMNKSVPKAELNIEAKDREATKEAELNRPLTKDEKTAIKDATYQTMIARAFPKRTEVYFILDTVNHYLFIGATATSQVEHVLALLRNAISGFSPKPVMTDINPSDALTSFVKGESDKFDELFIVGDNVVMESLGSSKINWNEEGLKGITEVKDLLADRYVTAATFKREDDTVSFKLDEYLHFSGLKFSDALYAGEEDSYGADLLLTANAVRDLFVDITSLMSEVK